LDVLARAFNRNAGREHGHRSAPLLVIIGNPPYSVGQKSVNDNAQNLLYEKLDGRISETYSASSSATNRNSLHDSYIKAFRWSSDRVDPDNGGVICFVTNGSWIDGVAATGFRCHLEKEFSSIYVFNLRGNCLGSGEIRRKEKGNVFGSGSRTPIAITVLVKLPNRQPDERAVIRYHAVGDYLSRAGKLDAVRRLSSINGIDWTVISPNKYNDWVNFRSESFSSFIPLGNKDDKTADSFFASAYSNGVKTARDQFCWNFSTDSLTKNVKTIIDFYNEQRLAYHIEKNKDNSVKLDDFVNYDSKRITWNVGFKQNLARGTKFNFRSDRIYSGLYRPFCRQRIYFAKELNDCTYQMPKLFPTRDSENVLICLCGRGSSKEHSVLITNMVPDLGIIEPAQCFPRYWYVENDASDRQIARLGQSDKRYIRRDAITDYIHAQSIVRYGSKVTKDDVFYYVYGILHSPGYRSTFASDLKKLLARLPLLESPALFWAFSSAGRKLADLHLNYESRPPPVGVLVNGIRPSMAKFSPEQLIVRKMSFCSKASKDAITYNSHIRISGIPLAAYDYVVNGKSAIRWVMERYVVSVHKESGIENDVNLWGTELRNPRYILDLLLSVIAVSVETVDVVANLPPVNWS
ncbi:MAG: damage-inducible protein, partial [Polyangiaceae bacterium]|nr:damage-inducible protein [Polyangiaceae bacterium]